MTINSLFGHDPDQRISPGKQEKYVVFIVVYLYITLKVLSSTPVTLYFSSGKQGWTFSVNHLDRKKIYIKSNPDILYELSSDENASHKMPSFILWKKNALNCCLFILEYFGQIW